MNTATNSLLGQKPAATPTPATSAKTLATLMLAAGVAATVVIADQLIDNWAESHVVAAWLALWAVAALAIGLLRGVTRLLAQKTMSALDAWSAEVARRRADQRLWSMAQSDTRLMRDVQVAIDRAADDSQPMQDITHYMTRRAARMVRNNLHYI